MSDITIDEPAEQNNDKLNYESSYKPWTTIIGGRSACTAKIYNIQKELLDINKPPITRDDIAKALRCRNLLRQTSNAIVLQHQVSIQFHT